MLYFIFLFYCFFEGFEKICPLSIIPQMKAGNHLIQQLLALFQAIYLPYCFFPFRGTFMSVGNTENVISQRLWSKAVIFKTRGTLPF